MSKVQPCEAYSPQTNGCINGFPIRAACWGYIYSTPFCCDESFCAHVYPETGRPPDRLIDRERAKRAALNPTGET